jgi:CRP/FNR family transcriptional regulator, cyclic AMP receptor protein
MDRDLLKNVPLFSPLSDEELKMLEAIAIKRDYGREEYIILQGEEGGSFFVILDGRVRVLITSPQGKEIILALLGKDDFFGEMSLLDGSARSASVVAVQQTRTLTINPQAFNDYLRKFPEVSIKLLRDYIRRLRQADRQIEHLALHSVKGRLARMILDWVVDYGTLCEQAIHFDIPLTHREIAGMLGTSRESVTRAFTELKEEGSLEMVKNRIIVSNLEALRSIALV